MRKLVTAQIAVLFLLFAGGCKKDFGIEKVEPPFGNVAGNDDVVITGTGFKPAMTVTFGSRQAKSVVIDGSERIRVKTPSSGEGAVDVIVTADDGKSFMLKDGFRFQRDIGK